MFNTISHTTRGTSDAYLFGYFGNGKGEGQPLDAVTKAAVAKLGFADAVKEALSRTESTGDFFTVTETFGGKGNVTRILLVGLGTKETFKAACCRGAAAAAGRRLAAVKGSSLTVCFEGVLSAAKIDASDAGSAFGEGMGILGWVCDEFRGTGSPAAKRTKLVLRSDSADFGAGVERGLGLAEATNLTRSLSQTPPNVATPAFMADQAKKLARKHGLSFKLFEGADLVREQFEGLINVGKASENKPCMIRLEYTPKGGAKGKKPVVLIGKTMTYDTGGLSLKINNGMVGMKRDKDGGCAVLGAMLAIATVIKPRVRVVALLAAAENSISDEAYRPDDVLRYRNNVTVEVTNTDAEGRLVLADALVWACEKESPSSIIDLATLTGGVVVALGSTYCGMFCEHDGLRAKIEAASAKSGERVWRLPMHAEYREMMKSPVADIVNSNPNRKAHPIQGAAFLSYFVDEKVPWCHLDIAGVHVSDKNAGMYIDGPTGWGVRLLSEFLDAE
ncbi:MAG: leucyl aminopeptidase family protein [Planctomycetota bacterium]|nr:leucyl aminopeptidase family protein [Planctomycetota bacterium]